MLVLKPYSWPLLRQCEVLRFRSDLPWVLTGVGLTLTIDETNTSVAVGYPAAMMAA